MLHFTFRLKSLYELMANLLKIVLQQVG